jgi:hypothetical protein
MTLTKSDGNVPDSQPMRLRVVVVRKGTVTGAPVTVIDNFFSEADVRLVGHNIGNAGVDVDIPGVTTKTIVSNTDTELIVRLRFSSRLGEAKGRIRLWDKGCSGCTTVARYWYQGMDGPVGFTPVTILGRNSLKDISVQTGAQTGTFVDGQTSTVTVTLLRPVDANLPGVLAPTATRSTSVGTTGVTVYWKMDSQVATPSSGQVVIPAGRDFATFTVRTKGYILAGNSAYFYPSTLKVEARTGSPTAMQAPELRVESFPSK